MNWAADLSTLGATNGVFDLTLEGDPDPFGANPVSGSMWATASAGTLSGSVQGADFSHPGFSPGHFLADLYLSITGGTGAFAGAAGTAEYRDQEYLVWDEDFPRVAFSGELSGSFAAPV